MQTTMDGKIEGYTPCVIAEVGEELVRTSKKFYEKVITMTENKEVIYRVIPEVSLSDGQYHFYTRIHIKD